MIGGAWPGIGGLTIQIGFHPILFCFFSTAWVCLKGMFLLGEKVWQPFWGEVDFERDEPFPCFLSGDPSFFICGGFGGCPFFVGKNWALQQLAGSIGGNEGTSKTPDPNRCSQH